MRTFVASAVECGGGDHPASADCGYQIAWSLNPHTVPGSADLARARHQHVRLLETVRALGATVIELPFVHGAFDSVFTKDTALFFGSQRGPRAIMARPRFAERQIEQGHRARAFAERGMDVVQPQLAFEGGDVAVHDEVVIVGYGYRSQRESAAPLARLLGMRAVALELVDPHLYHLDTAMTVVGRDTALYCEAAFSPEAIATITQTFSRAIAVSRDEAAAFGLNVVEVAGTIVTGAACPGVNARYRALGYDVVVVELDEFQRAGGSASCLLAPIHVRSGVGARQQDAA